LPSRNVDEDIKTPKLMGRSFHQLMAEGLIADISRDGHALATLPTNEVDDLLCVRLFSGKIIHRDVGSFASERYCGSPTNAGVGSGNQSLAAQKPRRSAIGRLAMVWAGLHFARQSGPRLLLFRKRGVGIFRNWILS
jgi:hypothetical protein